MEKLEKLKELKKLFDNGLLTEQEFILLKSEVISGNATRYVSHTPTNKQNIVTEELKLEKEASDKNFEKENLSNKKKTEVGNTSPEGKLTVIFFVIIAFIFLLLFSIKNESEKPSDSISSSSSNSTPKSNDGSETWIPAGYEKGSSCSDCNGTGHYTHSIEGTMVKEGGVCAGCNGRGYMLRKK